MRSIINVCVTFCGIRYHFSKNTRAGKHFVNEYIIIGVGDTERTIEVSDCKWNENTERFIINSFTIKAKSLEEVRIFLKDDDWVVRDVQTDCDK